MRKMVPLLLVLTWGCGPNKFEVAKSQVGAEAERLDGQVTATGGYIRPGDGTEFNLPEIDPWGQRIKATYTSGGFMETLKVRSAGPDRRFFNGDDVVEYRSKMTFGGVGEGIMKNAENLGEKASRGIGRGLIQGARDHIGGNHRVADEGDENRRSAPSPSRE